MRSFKFLYVAGVAAIGIAGYFIATRTNLNAQTSPSVKIKPDDIGGVVTSAKGPEAGVWVIAETTDLPTRYIKGSGHRRSRPLSRSPICPRPSTRSGRAAMDSSIRPKCRPSRASWSI